MPACTRAPRTAARRSAVTPASCASRRSSSKTATSRRAEQHFASWDRRWQWQLAARVWRSFALAQGCASITRYWRDWSSDVCSSDLHGREFGLAASSQKRAHAPATFCSSRFGLKGFDAAASADGWNRQRLCSSIRRFLQIERDRSSLCGRLLLWANMHLHVCTGCEAYDA